MNLAPVFRSQTRQVEQIDSCMFVQKHALRYLSEAITLGHFAGARVLAAGRCVDQQDPVFGIIPMSP
jgi:hypothetical protein